MEVLSLLADGFATSLSPFNLFIVIIGVTAGLFIGAMPGLGSVNGVAIVLPLTFIVPPSSAIILLAAIYYGAMYGGAVSSILLGIPGASTAVATTFDGRPMAQKGQAGLALIAAAVASFVGGTISVVLFTLFAAPLADIALSFGPAEEFALVLLAFTTFVGLGGDDSLKTIIMICLGLALSTVGLDLISGQPRLIFGDMPGFYSGISFLVLAIGTYGLGEILYTIETSKTAPKVTNARITFAELGAGLKRMNSLWKTMSLGSFLGFFVGMLPAAGATPAALMSYGIAKQTSKTSDTFGKGNIEGVAAPETANNAASTGSLLPMLTLGIPGSPTTALLLGGMVMWGLVPGPMLFIEQPDFVWGLISSLYTANFAAVAVNIALNPRLCLGATHAVYGPLCAGGGAVHRGWVCTIAKDARCVVDLCLWRGWVSAAQGRLSIGPLGSGACSWAIDGKKFPSNPDCGTGQHPCLCGTPPLCNLYRFGNSILCHALRGGLHHRRERAPACSQQTSKN